MILGKNCKVGELNITTFETNQGFANIEIGDECFLECNIILYNSNAKVKIGNRVYIGPDTTIFCYEDVEIEEDIMISWGCTIIDTNSHSLSSSERMNDVLDWKRGWQYKDWSNVSNKKITIRKKSWIGLRSIILKGVTLGEGTIVASGSVVTKSTEPFSIIGGNPAILIKKTT